MLDTDYSLTLISGLSYIEQAQYGVLGERVKLTAYFTAQDLSTFTATWQLNNGVLGHSLYLQLYY